MKSVTEIRKRGFSRSTVALNPSLWHHLRHHAEVGKSKAKISMTIIYCMRANYLLRDLRRPRRQGRGWVTWIRHQAVKAMLKVKLRGRKIAALPPIWAFQSAAFNLPDGVVLKAIQFLEVGPFKSMP